jgi:hypothetical protein
MSCSNLTDAGHDESLNWSVWSGVDEFLLRSLMKSYITTLPFSFLFPLLPLSNSVLHLLRSHSFLLHFYSNIKSQIRFFEVFSKLPFKRSFTRICSIMYKSLLLSSFAKLALGGTILWDGRFNDITSSSEFDSWSWSNQVGPYQYYIVSPSLHTYRLRS